MTDGPDLEFDVAGAIPGDELRVAAGTSLAVNFTGASGFVGRALCESLAPIPTTRRPEFRSASHFCNASSSIWVVIGLSFQPAQP